MQILHIYQKKIIAIAVYLFYFKELIAVILLLYLNIQTILFFFILKYTNILKRLYKIMAHDTIIDSQILNIIQSHAIREQMELQDMLEKNGYNIPQATLSRRLKKLKVAKVQGVYKLVDLSLPKNPSILNIRVSEFGSIVLHTYPGHGASLAYIIDRKYVSFSPQDFLKERGILGTIAGDDTVMVIVRGKSDIKSVVNILSEEFHYSTSLLDHMEVI